MSRILRINSTIVDIDNNTKVNLSYTSPIFSDLQKLTANISLTIKLPLSAHNRVLIENVNVIGVDSDFPYDYFRVDYEEDGLIIIDNGRGYLLSVSEVIEVSVIFGGVASFVKLKDAKLNQIPIPVEQGQIPWGEGVFEEVKPRILMESRVGRGLIAGRFPSSLRLVGEDGIIPTKYAKYQEVIRRPKTVKAEMVLTAKDKSELDLLIPVYIEQLEGYFAVINVMTKEYTSDVELLRL